MKPQRGAAILTAMLTVALVATLASAALWQQWRAVEVEAAERTRLQADWILIGALDWARLILREDARQGGADHLSEPWAVPLEQARLSTFVAADGADAQAGDASQQAFLSGQITDLQSRLNVTSLVRNGSVDAPTQAAFTRLFELLELPLTELTALTDNLRLAQTPATAATAMLWPQDLDQCRWLGLSARSIAVLRPFVTVLPVATPVNLNTAALEVIYASVPGFELADASQWLAARSRSPLNSLADATKLTDNRDAVFNAAQHAVASRFFEVSGQLRLEGATVLEQSVLQRDGMNVKTLWRRRSAAAVTGPVQ